MAKQKQEFHGYDKFDTSFLKRPRNYNEFEELGLTDDDVVPSVQDSEDFLLRWEHMGYDKLTPVQRRKRLFLYLFLACVRVLNECEVRWLIERYHKFKDFVTKEDPDPRSISALQRLAEHNLRLCMSEAIKCSLEYKELSDVFGNAYEGLNTGLRRFDPDNEKGAKLSTYVTWWIRQSVYKKTSEQQRNIVIPNHLMTDFNNLRKALSELTNGTEDDVNRSYEELAEYVNTHIKPGGRMDAKKVKVLYPHVLHQSSLTWSSGFYKSGDDVEDNMYLVEASMESGASIDDTLTSENQEKFLKNSMDALSARERDVIDLYYGLTSGKKMSPKEISAFQGVPESTIQRLIASATENMLKYAIENNIDYEDIV